jgi:hypothetical protein
VDDIAAIAEIGTPEDAIMMAQDKIACLDNMSLEGDLPDNVSQSSHVRISWSRNRDGQTKRESPKKRQSRRKGQMPF